MTSPPLVSILLPFYNCELFLGKAIESVWAQDHPNVELIAINDGSTDRSLSIAEEIRARSPIPMQVRSQPNAGPSAALHRALSLASGDWVGWLASDDMYAPNFISRSLEVARSLPMRDFTIHSNIFLTEESGKVFNTYLQIGRVPPLRGDAFEARVTGKGFMAPSTMFISRDFLLRAGGFDPTMHAEDHDLLLRLARQGHFEYIEEPLYYSRYNPDSLGKKPWKFGDDILRSVEKHADLLGPRLPELLAFWAEEVAIRSFEFGNLREGIRWTRATTSKTSGLGQKAARIGRISWHAARGFVRRSLIGMFGHENLVALKRAVAGPPGRKSGA